MTTTPTTCVSQLQAALVQRWKQRQAEQPKTSNVQSDSLDRFASQPSQPSQPSPFGNSLLEMAGQ